MEKLNFKHIEKVQHLKEIKKVYNKLPRNLKYLKKSIFRENTFDRYSILRAPCTSERFYKKMERDNTIIFYVNQKANKQQIKAAFKEAFNVVPQRINTMNTVLGRKKAFIKLPKGNEASEIANKIGLL